MWITRILVFLLLILSTCTGKEDHSLAASQKKLKILAIFPHLGKSHFDVFKPLLEELARRNHDLTVISHFPRSEKAKTTEPLVNYKDLSLFNEKLGLFINVVDLNLITDSYVRLFYELYMLHTMSGIACDICLNNPKVQELVRSNEKFDLILVESFNTNCFFSLVHRFQAPFIQISTHQFMPWIIDEMGLSNEASYIPALFTRLPRPMNFLQRTTNALTIFLIDTIFHTVFHWRDQSLATEAFGPGIPDLSLVSNNASLLMVNTHYTVHGSVQFPSNVIEVGGLHVPSKVNPLPKDIEKFLHDAPEGVLYFNLGSMVKLATMPKDKLKILLKVFGSIPRKVIWKWETDDIPDIPDNVLIKKWLPQYDILNHPNVKCYFGHGGLLGLTEGVQSGVPMILMPLYGDQHQNAIAAQARGVALVIKFSELNEETLTHVVNEIFNNTRYRENAKKLSKAFKDRPSSPLETAVWWTEYIGRGNGVPYLRSEAANMSWCKRNLVDVFAFVTIVFLSLLYLLYRLFRYLILRKKAKSQKSKESSKKRD